MCCALIFQSTSRLPTSREGGEKNAEDANLLARAKMWTGSIRNGGDGAAAKKTKQKKRLMLLHPSSTSELTVWVTARPLEQ